MTSATQSLISKYATKGILVDTNILLLYFSALLYRRAESEQNYALQEN